MAGWGGFFGKIADQFQGRIERVKNERERLINERQQIMRSTAIPSGVARVTAIDNRLREIDQILTAKASD